MVSHHNKCVTDLLLHPYILGIENVIFRASEALWTPEGNGQVSLETDAIFYTGHYYELPWHLIEFKSTDVKRQKAVEQLYKGRKHIQKIMRSDAYLYFVFKKPHDAIYYIETYGRDRRKRK